MTSDHAHHRGAHQRPTQRRRGTWNWSSPRWRYSTTLHYRRRDDLAPHVHRLPPHPQLPCHFYRQRDRCYW